MSDEQDTGSGSRWESGAGSPDEDTTELAAHEPTPQPVAEAPRDRRAWMRGRGAIGGAAVGIAAVFGLGGFAVGHAAADDGPQRPGFERFHHFPGDRDGRLGPRMQRDGMPGGPQQQQPPNVAPSPAPSAGGSSSSDDDSSS
jgi:hypothetical protein